MAISNAEFVINLFMPEIATWLRICAPTLGEKTSENMEKSVLNATFVPKIFSAIIC